MKTSNTDEDSFTVVSETDVFDQTEVNSASSPSNETHPSPVTLRVTHKPNGTHLIQVQSRDEETPALGTDLQAREPVKIVCVLDVSSSMDSAATTYDDREGNSGLSLLDIVKHATRTVIETLGKDDELAIVQYSNQANVVSPFRKMTETNKKETWKSVDEMYPSGSTNLWDGLVKAMDLIRNGGDGPAHVILLTDGQPNVQPPRGELESLAHYQDKHPSLRMTLSTCGFGYHLDSKLLRDLAVQGGGHFLFIPDSSFVGTVFVNATANILATALPPTVLQVQTDADVKPENLSGFPAVNTSWGQSIRLPAVLSGQTLDILVRLESQNHPDASFGVFLKDDDGVLGLSNTSHAVDSTADKDNMGIAEARSRVVALLSSIQQRLEPIGSFRSGFGFNSFSPRYHPSSYNGKTNGRAGRSGGSMTTPELLQKAQDDVEALLEEFPRFGDCSAVKAMQSDLQGQISEAISSEEYYRRWGCHYLYSLGRAYVLQQCTNFKDPGVQMYATARFKTIRDASDEKFNTLPPPKASRKHKTVAYRSVSTMMTYNSSCAPCFASGPVQLADGQVIDIGKLKAGHLVQTPTGPAKVLCIVATECQKGMEDLVSLDGGVVVTPWHPVRRLSQSDESPDAAGTGAKWAFPADLVPPKRLPCSHVYSFCLEDGASCLQIGPYAAVSLGHGITNDPVATHEYLGTKAVLNDLVQMNGWEDGLIQLGPNPCVRDDKTHLICTMKQDVSTTSNISDSVQMHA